MSQLASSNVDVVLNFIAAWNARDLDAIAGALAPDVVYHNIPMEPLQGRERIREAFAPMLQACSQIEWRVHNVAQTASGAVLTERTDDFHMNGKHISLPVMGTFEIEDGLITAWRDYFDLQQYQRQL